MIDRLLNEFLIQGIIDNRQVILTGLCIFAYSCLEYFLGKTNKVKAGSLLELILNVFKK